MKKRNIRWITAALLSAMTLAACGQDKDNSRGLRPDPEPTEEAPTRTEPETTNPATAPEAPEVPDDGAIHVDNVKDLLAAIEP